MIDYRIEKNRNFWFYFTLLKFMTIIEVNMKFDSSNPILTLKQYYFIIGPLTFILLIKLIFKNIHFELFLEIFGLI